IYLDQCTIHKDNEYYAIQLSKCYVEGQEGGKTMRLKRFLRLLLLSALGLSMLLAYSWLPFLSSSPTASAHAFVIGSDPVDGSTIHGVIGFNIGHSSLGLPGEVILGPSTSNILPQLDLQGVLAVAWDWLVMAALMLWLGILVVEGLILGSAQVENDLLLPQM